MVGDTETAAIGRLERAMTAAPLPFGASICELRIGPAAQLVEFGSARVSANIIAQCAAALQTAALVMRGPSVRLIFVVADDGAASGCESLLHSDARDRIDPARVLAALRIETPDAAAPPVSDEAVVMWIDDASQVDDAHYDPRYRSWRFRRLPLLDDAILQRAHDSSLAKVHETIAAHADENTAPIVRWPTAPRARGPQVILFCLYWLDFGGAEAFALQSIRAAKAAGYTVVVAADEVGRHRMIERLDGIADAVYLLGSYSFSLSRDQALLRVVELHRPQVLHIHHSWTAYRQLGTFRALGLVDRVIDTTHVLEYVGGFVLESILRSRYIDRHHVISARLKALYDGAARIPAEKTRLGRLHEMSRAFAGRPGKWEAPERIKVTFVGRFAPQKRPFLFLHLARRVLKRFGPDRVAFTFLGSGALLHEVKRRARRYRLDDKIAFLPGDTSAAEVLADTHVLVICSENEGLTLVSYEAIRADCVVISTDVGAQREITVPECLVPRAPHACVSQTADIIAGVVERRFDHEGVRARQRVLLEALLAEPSGTDVCLEFYGQSGP